MTANKTYRVDKFGRPIFKVIMTDGSFYFASPNFHLNDMTPKKVREFKKEIRDTYDDNYDVDEYDCPVEIKQIRFK